MSRILIIGSEGQLGSELSKFLKFNTDSSKIILSDIKEKSKRRKTQTEVIMQNKSTTSEFNQKVNY